MAALMQRYSAMMSDTKMMYPGSGWANHQDQFQRVQGQLQKLLNYLDYIRLDCPDELFSPLAREWAAKLAPAYPSPFERFRLNLPCVGQGGQPFMPTENYPGWTNPLRYVVPGFRGAQSPIIGVEAGGALAPMINIAA
jgi:hypothetical protein